MISSSLVQADYIAGYPDPVFHGQLREYQIQVNKLDPGAPSQPAPVHLAAVVGKYPQDAISWRL